MKKRTIIIAALVVLILAAAGVGYKYRSKIFKHTIKSVQPTLNADEQKGVEDKVSQTEQKIKDIGKKSDDAAKTEKFNLYMTLGFQQYSLGKLADARSSFETAKDIDPKNAGVWASIYQASNDMQDYSAARDAIKTAMFLQPDNSDYWKWYIDLQRQHFGASVADINGYYTDAIAKTSQSLDIITSYANYLESIGDIGGATNQWRLAAQQDPKNAAYKAEITRLEKIESTSAK
jgi:tetratricopeptide (TPR) repeat protein